MDLKGRLRAALLTSVGSDACGPKLPLLAQRTREKWGTRSARKFTLAWDSRMDILRNMTKF